MILFVALVASVLMLCCVFTCYRLLNILFPKEHRRDIFVAGKCTQIKRTDFWDVTPWSPAEVNQLSGGMHCLHIHVQRVSQAASRMNCDQSQNYFTTSVYRQSGRLGDKTFETHDQHFFNSVAFIVLVKHPV
jgi:hypothetical protein